MRPSSSSRTLLLAGCLVTSTAAVGPWALVFAQGPPRDQVAAALAGAEPSGQSAAVIVANRPIVVLRARVLGRGPAERAAAAGRALDDLAAQGLTGPVEWQSFEGGVLMSVASRAVLAVTHADVDELAGERVDDVAARAAERLRRALQEAVEGRTAGALLRSSAAAAAGVALALLVVWVVARVHATIGHRLTRVAERTVARIGVADVAALRASHLLDAARWLVAALAVVLNVAIVYAAIGFVLRQFPYTRPWGESMRGLVLTTAETLGRGAADAVPGLFAVAVIAVIARVVSRLIALWFNAIERGQLTPRWIYPETAQPTRRLLIAIVWAFAVVVAYPYVPGSQTDAFKGVSVFLGLILTLGSSGLVNQIVSGFMITYSRALRVGDFVKVGGVDGTVTHLGVLSVKLMTILREEATVPNATVVAQTTTDYSRFADDVMTPTSVTIGYDAPWRQVQSLLLLAAERTPGLRRSQKPLVVQLALEDFYVKYTLLVGLERQDTRALTLHTLHAHIQDLFNEHGVQIMSPHYVVDPAAPKIVRQSDWYAAPARPESPRDAASVAVST